MKLFGVARYLMMGSLVVQLLLHVCGCSTGQEPVRQAVLSKEDALRISNKIAYQVTPDYGKMNVGIDETNSDWNKFLSQYDSPQSFGGLTAKLKHRDYWAVFYEPANSNQFGGWFFVFVEKQTGRVIDVFRGQ
jgi:hypothetical protein